MNNNILIAEIAERILLKNFHIQQNDFLIGQISNPQTKCKWDAYIFSASCSPWLCEIKNRDFVMKNKYYQYGAMIEVNKFKYLTDACSLDKAKKLKVQPIYISIYPPEEYQYKGNLCIWNLFNLPNSKLTPFKQTRNSTTKGDDNLQMEKTTFNLSFNDASIYEIDYPETLIQDSELIFKYLY